MRALCGVWAPWAARVLGSSGSLWSPPALTPPLSPPPPARPAQWANALSVVAIEQLVGEDCDAAAEAAYQARVAAREVKDTGASAAGYEARFHQPLEAAVQWDVKYESKVADWKGIGWTI
jgi:hypothetical protein